MLSPEAAKERLKEWEVEESDMRWVGRLTALPASLRGIAFGLLNCDADGKAWNVGDYDWQERMKRKRIAVWPLDGLAAQERAKLFAAFFCDLAPAVESTWQLLKRFPYQRGYQRKSFRAASDAGASFEHRLSWLDSMIGIAARWKPGILAPIWLAAWAAHIDAHYGSDQTSIGRLLAAVIDEGGADADEVLDILSQSLRNEHEIGAMGRHVVRALLMAPRPEGWELVEKTLIAAQRQEGLRQVILETVDEAHPQAFVRMLRLIRDNDLARFSAVVRAADVWFGLQWDSVSAKVVNDAIDRALAFLSDDAAREKALAGEEAEDVFLALWAVAFHDALAAVPIAEKLLKHKQEEIRFVAVAHLCQLQLPQARAGCAAALDDEDLRVAWWAANHAQWSGGEDEKASDQLGLFERYERLFARLPEKPVELEPIVWPWSASKASRETAAQHMTSHLGDRPPTMLIPYLSAMSSWGRRNCIDLLTRQKKWDNLTRETLVRLGGDASSDVRERIYPVLAKIKLEPSEILALEGYLKRKSNDVRQGILPLVLAQSDSEALTSSQRLLASKEAQQRLAGLEVLREMATKNRSREECQARAETYRTARRKLTSEEQVQLDGIMESSKGKVTLENGLGLFDPAERSPAIAPVDRGTSFVTAAAIRCLRSLDELVGKNLETPVKIIDGRGDEVELLLGNVGWQFPRVDFTGPREPQAAKLPLRELWEDWYAGRPKALRDKDGCELIRGGIWVKLNSWRWDDLVKDANSSAEHKKAWARFSGGEQKPELKNSVDRYLEWVAFLHPPEHMLDFLLDAVETAFALAPPDSVRGLTSLPQPSRRYCGYRYDQDDWRTDPPYSQWLAELAACAQRAASLTAAESSRLWRLLRWCDEPIPGARRRRAEMTLMLRAYDHGYATFADFADHLIGPDLAPRTDFHALSTLTQRKSVKKIEKFLGRHPEIRDLVEACRSRIVDIELARGETPTAATAPARSIGALWGAALLLRLMQGLGKQGFKVVAGWRNEGADSKPATLTKLTAATYPKPDETPEKFRALARKAMSEGWLTEKLLLELVFLAPQWVKHVAAALGWVGFDEALYWFLAHMNFTSTKDNAALGAGVEDTEPSEADVANDDNQRKLSAWERLIAERTPLSDSDRLAGAVDVGWFRRIYAGISPKRWEAMAGAARFAANAAQARHAKFVAEVLTGKASRKQLIDGIRKKQLKDYVRLLGLFPLAGAKRQKDLVERYNVLQEYRRYARDLSSMTKPEALRSLDVGMQNLASTAGYADPLRLEWAMEAERVKKLAEGPISVAKESVTVALSLDEEGRPQITVEKAGKPLKSIPPALKKDKKIAELVAQATELKRQASLTRASLEAAMCRGDVFSGEELLQLCRHPLLAPQLNRLVLVGEGILGYPDKFGKALRDAAGKLEPVKKSEKLRIAHPHDLLESGAWSDYQQECFRAERVQPFKQVFRELYVVTKQEKRDGTASSRYATQQIQPRQATALWGQRGWHTQEGVQKTFYDAGLTVSVDFKCGAGTPLDVEGWTIDTIEFRGRDDYRPMKLAEVPPRIFSEAMRDIDLVVSVAHRGGVDPEASASTVEMRAALLRETCSLLGLGNVRVKNTHAVIDGRLATYSVHLGSASVHRMPGGSICLIAVPAQHRGRLFLPFADDDPRTAEVLSKVILLARDQEIQDPTILEQIRR